MENKETAEQAAIVSAENWLALIDENKASESWNEAASLFKSALSVEQWKDSLAAARLPLGNTVSRELKSHHYTTELPGAPDGEYVVIEYQTVFEKKKNSIETIVPMKDSDGRWRVSGYYIK